MLTAAECGWGGKCLVVWVYSNSFQSNLETPRSIMLCSYSSHGKAKFWLTSSSFQRLMRRRYAPGRPVNLSTKVKVYWCQVEALISFISRVYGGRPDVLLHDGLTFPKRRQCKRLSCWGWQIGKGTSWGWSCSPTLTLSSAALWRCRKGGATDLMD